MTEPLTQDEIRNLRRHIADYDTDPRRIGMLADGDKHDAFRDERRWLATLDQQAKELAEVRALVKDQEKEINELGESYNKRAAELAEVRAERDALRVEKG